jgi:hypothetical protein
MMRIRIPLRWSLGPVGGLVVAVVLAAPSGAAEPQAAEQSPVGGEHAHQHFVITGNGCVDINQVLFEPAGRGLHRGANASGPERGPWHIIPGLGCDDL